MSSSHLISQSSKVVSLWTELRAPSLPGMACGSWNSSCSSGAPSWCSEPGQIGPTTMTTFSLGFLIMNIHYISRVHILHISKIKCQSCSVCLISSREIPLIRRLLSEFSFSYFRVEIVTKVTMGKGNDGMMAKGMCEIFVGLFFIIVGCFFIYDLSISISMVVVGSQYL